MITFLTLFLGLTVGPQQVELAVHGEAARVVLSLDGETVSERNAAPWHFKCDFGAELRPSRLEAVAYDAEGAELGRTSQVINMKGRVASLALALEEGPEGRPVALRPVWRSAEHPRPETLSIELDGELLPAPRWDRVELPPLDLETLHFVTAEAIGPDGTVARTETAFGGVLGPTLSVESTALAVVVPKGHEMGEAADAAGILTAGGEEATVLSIEQGGVDIVAVVTTAATEGLAALRQRVLGSGMTGLRAGLGEGDRLFQVDPIPGVTRQGEEVYEMYGDRIAPAPGVRAGLLWWLTGLAEPPVVREPKAGTARPADAVAVAAMQAVASARPRAVLLVIGREEGDASRFPVDMVRRYLSTMHVPLAVWFVEPPLSYLRDEYRKREIERRRALARVGKDPGNWEKARQRRLEFLREAWGEVIDASEPLRLIDAAQQLRKSLEDQRVIWIDGAWLPQEVELTPAAGEAAGSVRWAG